MTAVTTPSSLRDVASASIRMSEASKGAPVKGTLRFGGAALYFETSKGFAEVVAQNPKVKSVLRGLEQDALAQGKTGTVLVSVTGRQVDGLADRQVYVTDLKVVGPLLRLERGLTKRGDQYFGTFAGKEVRVKPMSIGARRAIAAAAADDNSQVTGRFGAKGVFEAWNIAVPLMMK